MIATVFSSANTPTSGWSEVRVRAAGTFNLLDPLPAVAIGWSESAKQFRKCIGKKIDGKPRIFWLGRDENDARFTASVLSWCFDLMQTQGRDPLWTPDAEKWAMQHVAQRKAFAQAYAEHLQQEARLLQNFGAPVRVANLPVAPATASAPLREVGLVVTKTLADAEREHLSYLRGRNISTTHANRTEISFQQMHEVLPETTLLRNIGRPELIKLTSHFIARPVRKKTGKPMSAATIRTLFGDVKRLLEAYDGDGWEGPRGWQKLFRCRWAGLMTPQEQKKAANGKETFSLEELKALYSLANERQKMLMLLGLNCAFAQKEIATLLREDVQLESGIIDRIRTKTRAVAAVRGQWQLWPETTALVRRFVEQTPRNPGGLAMLTLEGRPLVDDTRALTVFI